MSGSPVYIDGRLIGAVSYALGSFSKEPIAGITPIDEMTDATTATRTRAPGARASQRRASAHAVRDCSRRSASALNWNRPFADRPGDAQLRRRQPRRRTRRTRRSARCCGRSRHRS